MTVTAKQKATSEGSSGIEVTEVLEILTASGRRKSDSKPLNEAVDEGQDWVHTFHELAPEMFHLPS